MREGVDFSSARPPAPLLLQHGKTFVVRYVSVPGAGKNLTRGEIDAYRAAGLDIVIVYETGGSRALAGPNAGCADARSALAQVLAVDGPADGVIYFAVDWDVQPAQMPTVLDYLRGCASVLGASRTGVYGGVRAVRAALDGGICGYAWQTCAWSWDRTANRTDWDPRAQLRQTSIDVQMTGGHMVDMNEAHAENFGQWGYQGGGLMAADAQAILDKLTELFMTDGVGFRQWFYQTAIAGGPGHPRLSTAADVTAAVTFILGAVGTRLDTADKQNVALAVAVAALPTAGQPINVDQLAASLSAKLPHQVDVESLAAALRVDLSTALAN